MAIMESEHLQHANRALYINDLAHTPCCVTSLHYACMLGAGECPNHPALGQSHRGFP